MRQSAERALDAASLVYAETGDPDDAQLAAEGAAAGFVSRCIESLDIRLHNDFASLA